MSNEHAYRLAVMALSEAAQSSSRRGFEDVVEVATLLLSEHIENGTFDKSVKIIMHLYGASVGIRYPLIKGETSGIKERDAEALVAASENDPLAFDLAVEIAAHDLELKSGCVNPLARFTARLLKDEIRRPKKRGRSRAKNWARDFWICYTVESLERQFQKRNEYFPTRNDESHAVSYCDAVVIALENLGIHLTYDVVKTIWQNGKRRGGAAKFLRDLRYINRSGKNAPFLFDWSVGTK